METSREQDHQPIDAIVKVTVTSGGMEAELFVFPPQYGGVQPTAEKLLSALAEAKVTYGINHEMIESLAANPQYNQKFTVAKGLQSVDGTPAELEYKVRLSKDLRPRENPDGSVDYKDLGIVQNVMENDVLCAKKPASPGEPGCNVLGVALQPRPGRDVAFPMGKNTKLSNDQLQLLAACDGQVDMIGQNLQVLNTYTITGDVSNATGNINFVGSLIINGNVLAGFTVQASGNITINGSVEDATVIAEGNVIVTEGILGGGQGSVKAEGFVKAKYIQSGVVIAGGDIESTFIQHSNIQSNSNVNVIGSRGRLTGGRVVARNNINCASIGGKNNVIPTTLEVGSSPATAERHRELEKLIGTTGNQISSLLPGISMLERMEKEGSITADKREMLNQAKAAYQQLNRNLAEMEAEMERVDEELSKLGYGSVNAKESIYPGVRIIIGSEQMLLENQYDFTSFIRGSEGISFVPYQA